MGFSIPPFHFHTRPATLNTPATSGRAGTALCFTLFETVEDVHELTNWLMWFFFFSDAALLGPWISIFVLSSASHFQQSVEYCGTSLHFLEHLTTDDC
jgi:hypothetical protein